MLLKDGASSYVYVSETNMCYSWRSNTYTTHPNNNRERCVTVDNVLALYVHEDVTMLHCCSLVSIMPKVYRPKKPVQF